MNENVSDNLGRLVAMNADQLRSEWRVRLGENPPPTEATQFLRLELAWRIQALRDGDLDAGLKRRLDTIARQAAHGPPAARASPPPSTGSTLVKEWNGQTYVVVILDHGYLFDGGTYGSLSEIARQITGARWSGPRFFGLTKAAPTP